MRIKSAQKHSIIIVVQHPTPLKGAPAQRLYSLYKILNKEYHVCIVGGKNLGEFFSRKLGINRIKAEVLNEGDSSRNICEINAGIYLMTRLPVINILINVVFSFFSAIYILLKKPDVVVVSIPPSDIVLSTFIVSRIIRALFVVDMRDPAEEVIVYKASKSFEKLFAKIFQKINYSIYRRADIVTVVTDKMKAILESRGVKSIVIPNGADLTIFKPLEDYGQRKSLDTNRSLTLVFSGTAAEYYDLKPLIFLTKIFNSKKICNIKLLLVGSIKKDLENFIHRLCIADYVHYLGFYPPEKLAKDVLPRCDIGVIPRADEAIYDYAIPAKFYEYVASGLPVLAICRKESALAEIILRYGVGWICEPKDYQCIISTLKEVCLNRDIVKAKRENALKLRKRIDRRMQAYKFLTMLEALLKYRNYK